MALGDYERLVPIVLHECACGAVGSTILWRSPTSPQRPMHDILQRLLPSPFLGLLTSSLSLFSPPVALLVSFCQRRFNNDCDFRNCGAGLRNTCIRTSASNWSYSIRIVYLTIRICVLQNHDDSVRCSAATPQHGCFYVMYPFPHRLPSWLWTRRKCGYDEFAWRCVVPARLSICQFVSVQSLTPATNEFLDMNIFHQVCRGWGDVPLPPLVYNCRS